MRASGWALAALLAWGSAPVFGYSDEQHEAIWQARLQAARYADREAAEACAWTPEEPITFADDIQPEAGIRKPELFLMISMMIRKDQNALAVYNAFHEGPVSAIAAEGLEIANAANLSRLKEYFEANDFPGVAEIGDNGVNAMLMLVAHADVDPEFQGAVLESMKQAAGKGRIPEYIPTVFQSIRPEVSTRDDTSGPPETSAASVGEFDSPRRCFLGTRSRLIRSHLRSNFKISAEAQAKMY